MIARIIGIVAPLLAEIVLLCLGAFFASTETGFTALSRISVRQMVKNKEKNAALVSDLKNHLDCLISTVLIGTNLITTLSSSVATAYAVAHFGSGSVSIATGITSVLVIMFCEIIPKTYAGARPQQVAIASAKPIAFIQKVLFPIVWVFDRLTSFITFV